MELFTTPFLKYNEAAIAYVQFISAQILLTNDIGIDGRRGLYLSGNKYEKHHIVPKSCGGSDDKSNLVDLVIKDHVLAHRLLVHAVHDDFKRSMQYAYAKMLEKHGVVDTDFSLEFAKELTRKYTIGPRTWIRIYYKDRKTQLISKRHSDRAIKKYCNWYNLNPLTVREALEFNGMFETEDYVISIGTPSKKDAHFQSTNTAQRFKK